jgi:hypothetical protein
LVDILPEIVISDRQLLAAYLGERIIRQRLNKDQTFSMIEKKSSARIAIIRRCSQTTVLSFLEQGKKEDKLSSRVIFFDVVTCWKLEHRDRDI